jgi:signal transduction histidine kinase
MRNPPPEADAWRRELERALHDGVQQDLIAIAVRVQLVRRLAETDPLAMLEQLDALSREIHDAVERVRELAAEISPPRPGTGSPP